MGDKTYDFPFDEELNAQCKRYPLYHITEDKRDFLWTVSRLLDEEYICIAQTKPFPPEP